MVKENETLVEVTPEIYAIGDVCNFNIVNKHHGEAPFEVNQIILFIIINQFSFRCKLLVRKLCIGIKIFQ